MTADALKEDRLYKPKQLLPFLPMGKTTLFNWSKDGRFPKAIYIGNTRYWRSNEVIDWLRNPVKWMEKNRENGVYDAT